MKTTIVNEYFEKSNLTFQKLISSKRFYKKIEKNNGGQSQPLLKGKRSIFGKTGGAKAKWYAIWYAICISRFSRGQRSN